MGQSIGYLQGDDSGGTSGEISLNKNVSGLFLDATNGRDLFLGHNGKNGDDDGNIISKSKLIQMLKREDELRSSPKYLSLMEKEATTTYDNPNVNINASSNEVWLSRVLENIQRRVVNEFGYVSEKEEQEGLEILRGATILFPNDEDIRNAAHYIKFNRSAEVKFKIGDLCPNVEKLFKLNGEIVSFWNVLSNNKYNMVVTGSLS